MTPGVPWWRRELPLDPLSCYSHLYLSSFSPPVKRLMTEVPSLRVVERVRVCDCESVRV